MVGFDTRSPICLFFVVELFYQPYRVVDRVCTHVQCKLFKKDITLTDGVYHNKFRDTMGQSLNKFRF